MKGRSLYSLLLIGDPKWYNFLIVILAMTTTTMPFSHSNLVKVAAESLSSLSSGGISIDLVYNCGSEL